MARREAADALLCAVSPRNAPGPATGLAAGRAGRELRGVSHCVHAVLYCTELYCTVCGRQWRWRGAGTRQAGGSSCSRALAPAPLPRPETTPPETDRRDAAARTAAGQRA